MKTAGAFQDGERGLEPNGGRCIGAGEERAQGFKRGGGQLVELVSYAGEEMGAGLIDRGAEFVRGAHPILDGGAMNSGGGSGLNGGAALCKGGDDLDLDGRQVAGFKGRRNR
jgi:hypothetical protein